MKEAKKHFGFLKTTALGGLFFLLPLIVLGALIGQLVPIVMTIAEALYGILPLKTPGGIALLLGIALAIVVLTCFVAGVIARRSIGQRISRYFEKNIALLFPRYTIIKEQMRGTLGGPELRPNMKPVVARMQDCLRIGFEIERGKNELVTVYLPGAPDAWSGIVVYLDQARVQPLDTEFWDTVAIFERLGRDTVQMVLDKLPALPQDPPASSTD